MRSNSRSVWIVQLVGLSMAAALAASVAQVPDAIAQTAKSELTIDDYERWRSIETHRSQAISADGAWVAYVLRYRDALDQKPVLHVRSLDSETAYEVSHATRPVFSDDARWVAAFKDLKHKDAKALRDGGKPVTRQGLLLDLRSGQQVTWEDVRSFEFAKGSSHLLVRRRKADRDAKHRGTEVILRDLGRGSDQLIGNVAEASFNKSGELLAYAVDAKQRDANGVHLMDLRSGVQTTLDSDALPYAQLTWNEDGSAVAFVKGAKRDKNAERDNVLLAYPDAYAVAERKVPASDGVLLDPSSAAGFPSGFVISERGDLTWSEDRGLVFFGIKEQRQKPDQAAAKKKTDEVANVDVWHWRDARIQSVQFQRAEAERNFTYRQALNVASGDFIRLTDSAMREVELARDGRWGVGRDERAYISDWREPRADLYRVDTSTGVRTKIIAGQILRTGGGRATRVARFSPDGRHFLYWRDQHYHAYDLDTGTSLSLTASAPVSFLDMQYDQHASRPPYGVEGWSSAGDSVILRHRYDLWLQPLDGSPATNLTRSIGADREIRFRYVRTDPEERAIDLSKPMLLSAYGQWTKKSGFYELSKGVMKELVYEDARFRRLQKARSASRYLFTRETFAEFPDIWVTGAGLKGRRRLTNANPQQAQFAWGHRILFDYTDNDGTRLQGILAVPDDYQVGERRPMIVDFYEKRSQELHSYVSPKYLTGFGSPMIEALSKGFLLMEPDVDFDSSAALADMLECAEAAVAKAVEMGYADPDRVGIHGHSFGGAGAAYIATRSTKFAAVGMAAGTTEVWSDFNHFWGWSYPLGGGMVNTNRYNINGQGRFGTDPWTNPDLYLDQSALAHVRSMNQPLLIMHGTSDTVANLMEGLQFYNALRFNGKNVIMLAYPRERHSLTGRANRRDFTIRAMQFFDHHLRGAPAPRWMVEGVPFLEKEARRDPE